LSDSQATRAALMQAGMERFATLGFDGATTEEIARHAGVNKAMISYHFGGKDGLYRAILEAAFGPVVDRLEAVAAVEAPPEQVLGELLEALREAQAERPAFAAMLLREVLSGGRHLEAAVLPRFLRIFGLIRETIDRGVRSGAYRRVDPLLTHLVIVGSTLFFLASEPLRQRLFDDGHLPIPKLPTHEDFTRHLRDLMAHALAADTTAAPGGRR